VPIDPESGERPTRGAARRPLGTEHRLASLPVVAPDEADPLPRHRSAAPARNAIGQDLAAAPASGSLVNEFVDAPRAQHRVATHLPGRRFPIRKIGEAEAAAGRKEQIERRFRPSRKRPARHHVA
jgi:hypothetical protein